MTYVLTNAHIVPVQLAADATRTAPTKPGFLARFYAALVESRMRNAERELRARHLTLNEAGIVMGEVPFATARMAEGLPFQR